MAVYLVTWNLNKEGAHHYNAARIKFLSGFTGLDSVYAGTQLDTVIFVNTNLTALKLYNHLGANLDKNDRLFVVRLADQYQGWINQETVDWLKSRL